MIILLIDTSNNKEIAIGLRIGDQEDHVTQPVDARRAQVVLPLVEELLQKHSLTLKELQAIEVNAGPGSFTGLRVGVSIANTLGTILKIPINGQPIGALIEPTYT